MQKLIRGKSVRIGALFVGLALAVLGRAGDFNGADFGLMVRDVPEGEQVTYRVTFQEREEKSFALDGDLSNLESFTYRTRRYQENGREYFEMRETERIRGGFRNEFLTVFEVGSYWRLLRYSETLYSFTGKIIRSHTSDYDDAAFSFPGPLVLTHCITYWLRGIAFDRTSQATFYIALLGDSSPPWRIRAKVGPIEEIEAPAGKFSCYKVTIVPDMGHILGKWKWASFIITPLIPDFFIWYSTEPPHPMVKFEGALGVKGITAVQIHELVSYQAGSPDAPAPE